MTPLFVIALVLQCVALCALLWFVKKFADALRELLSGMREYGQVLGGKAEEVSLAGRNMEGVAGDLHLLSDWVGGQKEWKTQEEHDDQALIAYAKNENSVEEAVPISVITEARLTRPKLVAATLSQLIEEARQGVATALQSYDYQKKREYPGATSHTAGKIPVQVPVARTAKALSARPPNRNGRRYRGQ